MKKLVLLLSVLLVLSTLGSSPTLAARPSFEYRIQSLLAVFCKNVFPFSGVFIVPGEILPIHSGGGAGGMLGGDADDYGNGRNGGTGIDSKGSYRLEGSILPGTERSRQGQQVVK